MISRRRNAALPWLVIALAIALLVVEQISLRGYIGSDFHLFHQAVATLRARPEALYGPPGQPLEAGLTLSGFIYPPPGALALLPFGLGGLARDFLLFTTFTLLSAALALGWIAARLPCGRAWRAGLFLLALASGPVFACRAGQIDLAILALTVAAVAAGLGRRPALAGALLAAGAWIKIYPALLMLPLWVALPGPARKRLLSGFALAAIIVPALTALLVPLGLWKAYFGELLPAMASRTIVNIYNQSLVADLTRLSLPASQVLEKFDALPVPGSARFGALAIGGIVVAAAAWLARSKAKAPACWLAMAAISLLAPLGWGHAYVYVLPLWLCVAGQAAARRDRLAGLVAMVTFVLLLPSAHHRFTLFEGIGVLRHLVYSRYALATLLLAAWLILAGSRAQGWNQRAPRL